MIHSLRNKSPKLFRKKDLDRRKRKTRETIFRASTGPLKEESYAKITVQQIIDRSDIGRTTFAFRDEGRAADRLVHWSESDEVSRLTSNLSSFIISERKVTPSKGNRFDSLVGQPDESRAVRKRAFRNTDYPAVYSYKAKTIGISVSEELWRK